VTDATPLLQVGCIGWHVEQPAASVVIKLSGERDVALTDLNWMLDRNEFEEHPC
jgi:hypothetical protein